LISFELTAEQGELQQLAHEFAVPELRPIAAEWDEREWMRDAKVIQVVEGTSEIQRQIVTTYLKGGPGDRQSRG
jgi:alkylation response protein AidB-like acyl-CoA dehydrogenase